MVSEITSLLVQKTVRASPFFGPVVLDCGRFALRLRSPCVLHLSSRVLPLTRNRPRTRCEPVECRWTPSSFGEAHVWTCCCGSVAGQLDTAGRPRSRVWASSLPVAQWASAFRDSVRRKPAKKPGSLAPEAPSQKGVPLRGHHPQRLVSCECSPLAARPLISDSLVSGYASCRWRRPAWGASLLSLLA